MPHKITVAYWHSVPLWHLWEPLYTVSNEISNTLSQMIWSSAMLGNVFIWHLITCRRCIKWQGHSQFSKTSFDFYFPQCTKACSFFSSHGGRCHCDHEVSHGRVSKISKVASSLCTREQWVLLPLKPLTFKMYNDRHFFSFVWPYCIKHKK